MWSHALSLTLRVVLHALVRAGSGAKSYNKGPAYTASITSRAGTPPIEAAPRGSMVPYKATEDGNHRHRNTITGIFRP
eukprot:COSAG05_NODE_292_length_12012_cov_12.968354_17_plen_78_part_00